MWQLTCCAPQDADSCHQLCSTTRSPTLHQVIPALERLVTKWEKKAQDPKYSLFHDALKAGINKLNKYYKKLDNSDAYILSLCTCAELSRFSAYTRTDY